MLPAVARKHGRDAVSGLLIAVKKQDLDRARLILPGNPPLPPPTSRADLQSGGSAPSPTLNPGSPARRARPMTLGT